MSKTDRWLTFSFPLMEDMDEPNYFCLEQPDGSYFTVIHGLTPCRVDEFWNDTDETEIEYKGNIVKFDPSGRPN